MLEVRTNLGGTIQRVGSSSLAALTLSIGRPNPRSPPATATLGVKASTRPCTVSGSDWVRLTRPRSRLCATSQPLVSGHVLSHNSALVASTLHSERLYRRLD